MVPMYMYRAVADEFRSVDHARIYEQTVQDEAATKFLFRYPLTHVGLL